MAEKKTGANAHLPSYAMFDYIGCQGGVIKA